MILISFKCLGVSLILMLLALFELYKFGRNPVSMKTEGQIYFVFKL